MATTAADLSAGQIAMVGEARYTYEHKTVASELFDRRVLASGEKSLYIPKFGTVTANDLTDGIDMTESQQLTMSGTTHTTDEAGCKVIITKKLRHQLKEDAYRAAGKVIGNAIQKKIDQDGLSLFSGLSNSLGAAATTLDLGFIAAACSQLMGQSEPVPLPYSAVFHPHQINALVDKLATPGTSNMPPGIQAHFLQQYWRGNEKLYGVPIFTDGNITADTADDAYGAVISKMCFIYLVGWEPETWVEEDGSMRGWEIGVVADYGMVEEDDSYGRAMLFDAAAPTS